MDAVTKDLGDYLDTLDAEYRRDSEEGRIAEEAAQLLLPGGECDPFDVVHVTEALGASDLSNLARQLEHGNDFLLGLEFRLTVWNYWRAEAMRRCHG